MLLAQGLVFLLWAYLMFRTLFRLARIAQDRQTRAGGGPIPGPGQTLRAWHDFATRAEHRPDRNRLIAVTLLLFALIALTAWLAPEF